MIWSGFPSNREETGLGWGERLGLDSQPLVGLGASPGPPETHLRYHGLPSIPLLTRPPSLVPISVQVAKHQTDAGPQEASG